MAWDGASNLSLGRLGHIAAGNGDVTSETSLNDCGRDSGTGQTAMWANFRPGATVFSTSYSGDAGAFAALVGMTVGGDVGTYMGDSSYTSGTTRVNDCATAGTLTWEDVGDSNTGSLYQSRIASRSSNDADYAGTQTEPAGASNLGWSITENFTENDKFRATEGA